MRRGHPKQERGVPCVGVDVQPFFGAEWIGNSEPAFCAEKLSVFEIETYFRIPEGSGGYAGLIFGANDPRLSGEHYIEYRVDVKNIPAVLEIYRVGYFGKDSADTPMASVTIDRSVINEENRYDEHKLIVKVTGNCAFAYIDDAVIDSVTERNFFGMEYEAPRCLNALGASDVTTYPRLCDVGRSASEQYGAMFSSITVRNLRAPGNVIAVAGTDNDTVSCVVYGRKIAKLPETGCTMLKTSFQAGRNIRSAKLFATARGIYDFAINGSRGDTAWFPPGNTQYDKHIEYQQYDIEKYIVRGSNTICFALASGWWSDAQTYDVKNCNYYGDRPSLLACIDIEYSDGTHQLIPTSGDKWCVSDKGALRYAGFFGGEIFDANLPDFVQCSADASIADWRAPSVITPTVIPAGTFMGLPAWPELNATSPEFIAQEDDGVRTVTRLRAVSMIPSEPGIYIYDIGQNAAGVPRIFIRAAKGSRIRIRYAEMLCDGDTAGTKKLMTDNLRDADSTDIYVAKGGKFGEYIEPRFTLHGFRYIEISGPISAPALDDIEVNVLSSIKITGEFVCSNKLVNRFAENTQWSQMANFISIPTDCPQRNERMGWLGDAFVFAPTAFLNADVKGVYKRYLRAIRDLQKEDGQFPYIAPMGGGFGGFAYQVAPVFLTWETYLRSGDINIVYDNIDSLTAFMEYADELWRCRRLAEGSIGDWLGSEDTDSGLICEGLYIRALAIMIELVGIVGEIPAVYEERRIQAAERWNKTYIREDGCTLCTDGSECATQCSYALALHFDLINDRETKKLAAQRLAQKAEADGYHVLTGFFGTPFLCKALSENGYHDVACRMMTQTQCPSWLYPVTQGATTIWERWDSYSVEKGFGGNNSMNSFNHYSLGAVCAWLYENVAGISPAAPGYRLARIKPEFDSFDEVSASTETPYGRISSEWRRSEDSVYYRVSIPCGVKARLYLKNEVVELGSGVQEFVIEQSE